MDYLYHYYEQAIGPFRNLSDLPADEAAEVLDSVKHNKDVMAGRRAAGYMKRRYELEQLARTMFISKGGKPVRKVPHYMVVGECEWLNSWYEEGAAVKIHISSFNTDTLSFSYGDLFPTFSPKVDDGKEYRGNIYTYKEMVQLIHKYGLPQVWNKGGTKGPERYIEVQVWDDEPLQISRIKGEK
ncbi:hypothetical protein PAECIP111892_01424 [Paenibacillus auburnensis]|uniref:Uncharacterized protein n=1 Tax=Paenibacillus auburnensis TaxID=2905649 RepID=A0ABN8G228_9BACL|nr:hypothetical protein [Paenibacillus auburnensis]CAH1194141.1 hypothetical protein PAECIP111892_01424 [Paenibacillus auburnensis]